MPDDPSTNEERILALEASVEALQAWTEGRDTQQLQFPLDTPTQQLLEGLLGTGGSSSGSSGSFDVTKPMGLVGAFPGGAGGLAPSTTYYYVMTAIDASGNESYRSNEVSGTTSTGTTYSIVLQFHPYPGAVDYKAYRTTTPGNYSNSNSTQIPWGNTGVYVLDNGSSTTHISPP